MHVRLCNHQSNDPCLARTGVGRVRDAADRRRRFAGAGAALRFGPRRPGGGTCAAELRSSGCPNDARTVASRHSFSGPQRRCQVAGGTGSPGGIRRFARRRSHLRGRCRLVSNDRQPAAQGRRPDAADRRPYGKCPRGGRIAPQPARKAVASRRGEEFKARSLRGSRPRSSSRNSCQTWGSRV